MEKKVILITGVSSGIGKASALYLAEKGCTVYGVSRNPSGAELKHDNITCITMDVQDENRIRECVGQVLKESGHIDVLINNAGIGNASAVEYTTIEECKRIFDVNVWGYLRVIQNVLPGMRKQGRGLIINMSSMLGIFPIPYQGAYGASKFAIEGLSQDLSLELKPFNIKVALIQPGDIKTGFVLNRIRPEIDQTKTAYAQNFANALSVFEEDEKSGLEPVVVAKLIYKIIRKKNPKFRYIAGSAFQRLAPVMYRCLPYRVFENIFFGFYRQTK